MCIIIYRPEGREYEKDWKEQLAHCWKGNKDGCGIMMRHKGKVYIRKGLWTAEETIKLVDSLPKTAELAVHFRWTSAGKTTKKMCHPFCLEKGKVTMMRGETNAALMHNGTIRNLCFKGEKSDTYYLSELLSKYHHTEMVQERMMDIVETIASGSRVIIFTNKETLMWGDWTEYEGCFYSNTGFRRKVVSSEKSNGEFGKNYYLEFDPKSNSYVRKTCTFF